jgi:hypothetical protein
MVQVCTVHQRTIYCAMNGQAMRARKGFRVASVRRTGQEKIGTDIAYVCMYVHTVQGIVSMYVCTYSTWYSILPLWYARDAMRSISAPPPIDHRPADACATPTNANDQ